MFSVLCTEDGVLRKDMTNSNFPLFESLLRRGTVRQQQWPRLEATMSQLNLMKDSSSILFQKKASLDSYINCQFFKLPSFLKMKPIVHLFRFCWSLRILEFFLLVNSFAFMGMEFHNRVYSTT